MATSTVALLVLLTSAMLGAPLASDDNFIDPPDIVGALVARMRTSNPNQLISWEDDTIDTLSSVTPCSVPDKPDPRYYYPDFPECRKGNCPDCEPLRGLPTTPDFANPQDQPQPSSFPDMSKPQVQPQPPSAPDMSRPQVQPQPASAPDMSMPPVQTRLPSVPDFSRLPVQARPLSVPDYSRPQVQPRPISAPAMSRPKIPPRPPIDPDYFRPQVQPRPQSVFDFTRPQIKPQYPFFTNYTRPQVSFRPQSIPDLSRPQIDPMPPQIQDSPLNQVPDSTRNIQGIDPGRLWVSPMSPGYPSYPSYPFNPPNPACDFQPVTNLSPACPTGTVIPNVMPPNQCPNTMVPGGVSQDLILKIINDGGYCESSECSKSVTELMLRITLLEDRLRALVKCETRLKVYTNILTQIQQKIGESVQGKVGPPGEEGYTGQRGPRGDRGPPGQCNNQGGPSGGIPGPPGPVGPKGEYGPPGDKICDCDGLPGPPGFIGYAFTGNPGPKGMKGQAGLRGQDFNPMNV